jgi:pyruvate dehydrogenase E2 component (dihydrolipoamide acetyltransferase)
VAGGKLEIASVMTVTMSCDHRVIDGATGARFLQVFKQYIEEPAAMLL